jgi:hypothetical protein
LFIATNLLAATGQRRYAIKRSSEDREAILSAESKHPYRAAVRWHHSAADYPMRIPSLNQRQL